MNKELITETDKDPLKANENIKTEKLTLIDLFNEFLRKVFIEKKSFLSSKNTNVVYSNENMKLVQKCYVDEPIYFDKDYPTSEASKKFIELKNALNKDPNFVEKIKFQFINASDDIKIIFSDILWLRYLPIHNISKDKKVKACCSLSVINADEIIDKFPQKEKGIASYGQLIQWIDKDIVFLINILTDIFNSLASVESKVIDLPDIKKLIVDKILGEKDYLKRGDNVLRTLKNKVPIASMLLNLCEPEKHEPIASFPHKFKIIKYFGKLYFKDSDCIIKYNGKDINTANTDELSFAQIEYAISIIKNKVVNNPGTANLEGNSLFERKGFYYYKIRELWDNKTLANIEEIFDSYHNQIILYGAPGTGKTYNAEKVRDSLIQNTLEDKEVKIKLDDQIVNQYRFSHIYNEIKKLNNKEEKFDIIGINTENVVAPDFVWEIIQLNQSYSYEDFIEGLYPDSLGKLYVKNGIFKNLCLAAQTHDQTTFLLIIDEINRGKIDRIFGELLYALEYRNKPVKLHYSNDDLIVPENIFIIGTMNTADKSIAMIDVALRRRFWFVKLNAERNLLLDYFNLSRIDIKELKTKIESPIDVKIIAVKLFDLLNGYNKNEGRIKEKLKNDAEGLEIGHSYFMKLFPGYDMMNVNTKEESEDSYDLFERLKNIWFFSIIPLLEEYCNYNQEMLISMLRMKNDKNLLSPQDFSHIYDDCSILPNK